MLWLGAFQDWVRPSSTSGLQTMLEYVEEQRPALGQVVCGRQCLDLTVRGCGLKLRPFSSRRVAEAEILAQFMVILSLDMRSRSQEQ